MTDRLRAVVEGLDVRPDARVLEIGCGHGVAAMLVERLAGGGRLTAIDRSPKMIAAAAKRNAAFVDAGIAEFLVADLERLDLGERRYDTIFAVRVSLFHREPRRARELVEPWLAPGGRIVALFDPPTRAPRRPRRHASPRSLPPWTPTTSTACRSTSSSPSARR